MIAFIDPLCRAPYSRRSLESGGLGGTEATVIRIAEGLDAQVFQHNRTNVDGRYRPLGTLTEPSSLVVLRNAEVALRMASLHPGVPLFLWMHDLVRLGTLEADQLRAACAELADRGATLIAVSDYHLRQIEQVLDSNRGDARPRVVRLYNPLRPDLTRGDAGSVDRDQLIYFSSPYKGLGYALWLFKAVRRRWPSMRLLVANPGYFDAIHAMDDGVVQLGPLAQASVLAHVARSLCTFAPNFEYPETFGLVIAESNAVGTPVLGHAIGAAPEVCRDPEQIFETPTLASSAFLICQKLGRGHARASRSLDRIGAFDPYLERLARWRDGQRPTTAARPEFSLDEVLARWTEVLDR